MLSRLSTCARLATVRFFSESGVCASDGQAGAWICDSGREVVVDRGHVHRYNTAWLRDHCRAEGSYLKDSCQRARDILEVGMGVEVTKVDLRGDELVLEWRDGGMSKFGLDWLEANYSSKEEEVVPLRLWDRRMKKEIMENCSVDWSNVMKSDDGLYKLIHSVLRYGCHWAKKHLVNAHKVYFTIIYDKVSDQGSICRQ